MPRGTKSVDTALRRAADLLPRGKVRKAGRGQRRLTYTRPNGFRNVDITGSTASVLYHAVFALSAAKDVGGFGYELEELREKIKLTRVPTRNVGAHEELLLRALDPRGNK